MNDPYALLGAALATTMGARDYSDGAPELNSLMAGYILGLNAALHNLILARRALAALERDPTATLLSPEAQRLILEFITKEDPDESA